MHKKMKQYRRKISNISGLGILLKTEWKERNSLCTNAVKEIHLARLPYTLKIYLFFVAWM